MTAEPATLTPADREDLQTALGLLRRAMELVPRCVSDVRFAVADAISNAEELLAEQAEMSVALCRMLALLAEPPVIPKDLIAGMWDNEARGEG